MADIVYPYEVVVYGSDSYVESDAEGLVTKTDVTGGTHSLLTREAYQLKPTRDYKADIKHGEGGTKMGHTSQYQSFDIEFVRFNNADLNNSDIDNYESLMDILNKRYKYLEITEYKRDIKNHIANSKLMKIVIPEAETSFYPNKIGLRITAEVVKSE